MTIALIFVAFAIYFGLEHAAAIIAAAIRSLKK